MRKVEKEKEESYRMRARNKRTGETKKNKVLGEPRPHSSASRGNFLGPCPLAPKGEGEETTKPVRALIGEGARASCREHGVLNSQRQTVANGICLSPSVSKPFP